MGQIDVHVNADTDLLTYHVGTVKNNSFYTGSLARLPAQYSGLVMPVEFTGALNGKKAYKCKHSVYCKLKSTKTVAPILEIHAYILIDLQFMNTCS